MAYNSKIHHRRSIRLKGYDYSQPGLYFITLCCQHRQPFFGTIENGEMILNDAGKMVERWYHELMNKFPDIHCDIMVIMPDHFHFIIQNVGTVVGIDLSVKRVGADLSVCPYDPDEIFTPSGDPFDWVKPVCWPKSGTPLYRVVQWFKTMTTNEYIRGVKNLSWKPFPGKLWQRNYYEHIIRNQRSYENISEYILNNPANWQKNSKQ